MNHADVRLTRVIRAFEALTREDLARLDTLYTADASFKDPFNEVRGVPAIRQVYAHMFDTLIEPRFVIREALLENDQAFLAWDFVFRMKRFARGQQRVHGSSHLRLAADGRIAMHRDYWDAAEELYEKLPLLGGLMRWLKRRVNA